MPILMASHFERAADKSKKWDEFLKPKSELLPNRISERLLPESKDYLSGNDHCLVMMRCITGTGQLRSFPVFL